MKQQSRRTWIGVDVAKASFAAARRRSETFEVESFPQSDAGYTSFAAWLSKVEAVCVVLESTGPYWRPLGRWMEAHSIPYARVNPRRVRDFARSSPEANKTDLLDAAVLVHFAETFLPKVEPPRDEHSERLQVLWRHRLQLRQAVDKLRDQREKARVGAPLPDVVEAGLEAATDQLKSVLDDLEREAIAIVRRDTTTRQTYRLLLSIPGVGPKTAITLISEYGPRLRQASPGELTRFAGLNPVVWESGTSVRRPTRISKQGNHRIRRALFMAALSGMKCNPVVRRFYDRKVAGGLRPKQALTACMRKILHLCYGVLRNQQEFQPNYSKNLAMNA